MSSLRHRALLVAEPFLRGSHHVLADVSQRLQEVLAGANQPGEDLLGLGNSGDVDAKADTGHGQSNRIGERANLLICQSSNPKAVPTHRTRSVFSLSNEALTRILVSGR